MPRPLRRGRRLRRVLEPIWASVLDLGPDRQDAATSFFALGGDSILGLRLLGRAARAGIRIAPRDLFAHPSLDALCIHLAGRTDPAGPTTARADRREKLPLTPIQHQFFAWELPEPGWYVQSQWLTLAAAPKAAALRTAVAALIAAHDALRLRFEPLDDTWTQICDGPPADRAAPAVSVDLRGLARAPRERAMRRAVARLQRACEPLRGALVTAAAFDLRTEARLLLVVHHLAIDAVSWPVLLEDLDHALRDAEAGRRPRVAPFGTPFTVWAETLTRQDLGAEERAFWNRLDPARLPPALPRDHAHRDDGYGAIASELALKTVLPPRRTADLLAGARGGRVDEVLLTALARAFAGWSGRRRLLVELEGHGRGDGDLARTVGWLTVTYPLLLDLRAARDDAETLAEVRSALRSVPRGGLGWGLHNAAHEVRPEVLFNYLGTLDATDAEAPWKPADDTIAQALERGNQGRGGERLHLFELNAGLREDRLEIEWAWSETLHEKATVEALAASFEEELEALIRHLHDPASEEIFPPAPMQQGLLVQVLAEQGSGVYVEHSWWDLPPEMPLDPLRAGWQELLDRHAALRARFLWRDGRPRQSIPRRVEAPWHEIDLTRLGKEGFERAFTALAAADRRRGFNPARAPLTRWLAARGAHGTRLLWSVSHLILDGRSTPILLEELEDLLAGRQPPRQPHGTMRRPGSRGVIKSPRSFFGVAGWRASPSRPPSPKTRTPESTESVKPCCVHGKAPTWSAPRESAGSHRPHCSKPPGESWRLDLPATGKRSTAWWFRDARKSSPTRGDGWACSPIRFRCECACRGRESRKRIGSARCKSNNGKHSSTLGALSWRCARGVRSHARTRSSTACW